MSKAFFFVNWLLKYFYLFRLVNLKFKIDFQHFFQKLGSLHWGNYSLHWQELPNDQFSGCLHTSLDLQTARATAAVPNDKEDEFWASADLMSKRWQATPKENLSQTGVAEGPTTPLKTKLDIYMKLPFPNSSKLDILAWWNGQKVKCFFYCKIIYQLLKIFT